MPLLPVPCNVDAPTHPDLVEFCDVGKRQLAGRCFLCFFGCVLTGVSAEHDNIQKGISHQTVSAVDSADSLTGYEQERAKVLANTRALLAGPRNLASAPTDAEEWLETLLTNARQADAAGDKTTAYNIARQLDDALPSGTVVRDCAVFYLDQLTNPSAFDTVADLAGVRNVLDAVRRMGAIIRQTAEATVEQNCFGCAKLVVFANAVEDNPFMAGAFHGPGEPECVVNVGVSGPGVVQRALEAVRGQPFDVVAETIKRTAFKITRVGELVAQEAA